MSRLGRRLLLWLVASLPLVGCTPSLAWLCRPIPRDPVQPDSDSLGGTADGRRPAADTTVMERSPEFEVLARTTRVLPGCHTLAHPIAGTMCRTPWPEPICRCGYYLLEWPPAWSPGEMDGEGHAESESQERPPP